MDITIDIKQQKSQLSLDFINFNFSYDILQKQQDFEANSNEVEYYLLIIIITTSKLMENEYQRIRGLLIKMTSAEVNEAQEQLMAISNNQLFFQIILHIIKSPTEEDWLKTIASTFLSQVYETNASLQHQEAVFTGVMTVLCDPLIKPLDKRSFEKCIIKILEESSEEYIFMWQRKIYQFMQSKVHFDTAYLLLACFAVADIPQEFLRNAVHKTFEPILSSLQVCIQNANLLNEMVKMWIVIIDKLRQSQESMELLIFMSNSPKILILIDLILQLEAANNIFVCVNPDLFELNLLKYETAEIAKRLLTIAEEHQNGTFAILLEYTKKNLPRIFNTLQVMTTEIAHIESFGCEDLITTFISICQLYVLINPSQFDLYSIITFQNNVIFPLIRANDEEREKFEESPQEFNSLTEDCCDKQTFGILKTEAVKLLEILGDKVEGSLEYSLDRAVQSLKIQLGFVQQDYQNQGILPLDIETSFLILSVFSYGIGRYQKQLSAIKIILLDQRMKTLPPMEISRIFTFLAYNYGQLFKNPKDGENWISFALTYQAHPTARYLAYDFLSNLVEDYFNQIFLNAITDEITNGKISLVWEVVTKILENHYDQLSAQGIISIINKLFIRIQREIRQLEKNEKNNTLDVINCLRIFSNILLEIKSEDPENLEAQMKKREIIPKMWPILEFYSTALKYDIDDEVVKIAVDIVENLQGLVPEFYPIIQHFAKNFHQNGSYEKIYLRFFNQILVKANFDRDLPIIMQVIVSIKNAFFQNLMKLFGDGTKMKGTQVQRLTVANLILIIQNIIGMFGNRLMENNNSENFFTEISSLCIRILPRANEEVQKTTSGRILISRALNTLILCHLHIRMDSTFDYLRNLASFNLYHGHDTKVLVMCLCKEILKEVDFTAVLILLSSMLTIVNKSDEKNQIIDKTKKRRTNKIKTAAQLKKIGDFDKFLKYIDTPFDGGRSIKDQISELLGTMKYNNYNLFRSTIDKLPMESIQLVKEYIDIQNEEPKKRVIRKVIGVKVSFEDESKVEKKKTKRDAGEMGEDGSGDELEGLKRDRAKLKADEKERKKNKQSKPNRSKKIAQE